MTAYDPFDPVVAIDPYPAYGWLRDEAPLHHSAVTDTYVLSRYDDVWWALNDAALLSSDAMRGVLLGQPTGVGEERLPREAAVGNLVAIDPPGHTELRCFVNRGDTTRHAAQQVNKTRQKLNLVRDSLRTLRPHLRGALSLLLCSRWLGLARAAARLTGRGRGSQ